MDKRTKEYKAWKKKQELGIGDVIEKVTEATGIKKVVDVVFDKLGKDCGCEKRKEWANKNLRFRFKPIRCFTEKQYNDWTEFREYKGDLTNNHILLIHECYEQIFVVTFKRQSCCYEQFIKEINTYYETYL